MAGIIEQLANLQSGLAQVQAALGSHKRVPEMRRGTITGLSPDMILIDGDTAATAVTGSDDALYLGARVRVQVQGRDRWVVSVAPWARGAVFAATGVTVNALTNVTLARTSGDTDMVTAGQIVIPSGWGGTWAILANWTAPGTLASSSRNFVQLTNTTSGAYYRTSVSSQEAGGVVQIVTNVAAGVAFQLSAFTSVSVTGCSFSAEAWRVA